MHTAGDALAELEKGAIRHLRMLVGDLIHLHIHQLERQVVKVGEFLSLARLTIDVVDLAAQAFDSVGETLLKLSGELDVGGAGGVGRVRSGHDTRSFRRRNPGRRIDAIVGWDKRFNRSVRAPRALRI